MPELVSFLKKDDIDKMVAAVAHRISADDRDRELVLIGVLKGAFIFLSDLVRHLTVPVQIDFICVSGYGSATSSSGNIRLTKETELDIKNKDVLAVEDIVDTGMTLEYIADYLKNLGSTSVRVHELLMIY